MRQTLSAKHHESTGQTSNDAQYSTGYNQAPNLHAKSRSEITHNERPRKRNHKQGRDGTATSSAAARHGGGGLEGTAEETLGERRRLVGGTDDEQGANGSEW
jgi:hypothetical protein